MARLSCCCYRRRISEHPSLRFISRQSRYSADMSRGGLPRFYIPTLPKSKGMSARVDGDEFFHMTKVLRLGVDDSVELFDGRGGICCSRISSIGKSSMELITMEDCCKVQPSAAGWHVAAAFATLKGGRADWLIEKCTELGARTLTPLVTERSNATLDRKNSRWQRLVLAAAKQCQRLHSLELKDSMQVQDFAANVVKDADLALLATAGAMPVAKVLGSLAAEPRNGVLIVGPEGDFTDVEKELLIEAGATAVGLGPRRLRVETAVIAMLSTLTLTFDVEDAS